MSWRLEAWNPDYALPQAGLEADSEPTVAVEADLEPPWQAITPRKLSRSILFFTDGRQRVDAVIANEVGSRALLVTVAVGALVRDEAEIKLAGEPWVRRYALHTGEFGGRVEVGPGLVYQPLEVQARDLRELASRVNHVMRSLEYEFASQLGADAQSLVIMDGPIYQPAAQRPPDFPVIGYAKTMWQRYLPPEKEALLNRLEPAQRTPVFHIPASGRRKLELFSWYMRLPLNPTLPFHAGAGLIRVETPCEGLEEARYRADLSVNLLCQMASTPARDPRAPQNLIPVGGLELLLGRYMGQGDVLRRRIVGALFDGVNV